MLIYSLNYFREIYCFLLTIFGLAQKQKTSAKNYPQKLIFKGKYFIMINQMFPKRIKKLSGKSSFLRLSRKASASDLLSKRPMISL